MSCNVRVILSALERDIHGELQAVCMNARKQVPEIFDCPQSRMQRRVPAFGRAYGPRAAHVSRLRDQ